MPNSSPVPVIPSWGFFRVDFAVAEERSAFVRTTTGVIHYFDKILGMQTIALLILGIGWVAAAADPTPARMPVLVELFTSEGCSSCPPADALLEKLDHSQPVPGAEIIVLSEHVDYWNHLGWSDPYSSAQLTRRQESYALRFDTSGPYTPQMVVDGTAQFVGSDGREALSAIGTAAQAEKLNIRMQRSGAGITHVEIDPAPRGGDVYLVLAENSASSQVLRGENQGRSLHHVAVVRRMEQIGKWNGRKPFIKDISSREGDLALRLIVFVQQSGAGRILGAAALEGRQ
jgi:hypothetical protein